MVEDGTSSEDDSPSPSSIRGRGAGRSRGRPRKRGQGRGTAGERPSGRGRVALSEVDQLSTDGTSHSTSHGIGTGRRRGRPPGRGRGRGRGQTVRSDDGDESAPITSSPVPRSARRREMGIDLVSVNQSSI